MFLTGIVAVTIGSCNIGVVPSALAASLQPQSGISFLAGSWTCINSHGIPTGRSVFQHQNDGKTIVETNTNIDGSRTTSTYAWDEKGKSWHNVWLSSQGWVSHKKVTVSKSKVVMVGTTYFPDGDKVSERETLELAKPGILNHTVHQSFDGKTWREIYAGTLNRNPSATDS